MQHSSALQSDISLKDRRFVSPKRSTSSRSAGRYRKSPRDFIVSFYAVLNRWRSETAFISDPDQITSHPSFNALVAHALVIYPLIIDELRVKPSCLVWVLDDAFPNEVAYPTSAVGDFVAMAEGWIAWAEQQNGRAL